jgi:two-component sensor histidine kinase
MKPSRKGFGTVVLERMVHQISGASASLEFIPSGVKWYLEAPVEALTEEYGLISVENDLGAL